MRGNGRPASPAAETPDRQRPGMVGAPELGLSAADVPDLRHPGPAADAGGIRHRHPRVRDLRGAGHAARGRPGRHPDPPGTQRPEPSRHRLLVHPGRGVRHLCPGSGHGTVALRAAGAASTAGADVDRRPDAAAAGGRPCARGGAAPLDAVPAAGDALAGRHCRRRRDRDRPGAGRLRLLEPGGQGRGRGRRGDHAALAFERLPAGASPCPGAAARSCFPSAST